jgi:Helix-turn-helix domain
LDAHEGNRALTNDEAASFLRISRNTLNNWRTQRKGPNYIRIGSRIFYDVIDLIKYQKSHKIILDV